MATNTKQDELSTAPELWSLMLMLTDDFTRGIPIFTGTWPECKQRINELSETLWNGSTDDAPYDRNEYRELLEPYEDDEFGTLYQITVWLYGESGDTISGATFTLMRAREDANR